MGGQRQKGDNAFFSNNLPYLVSLQGSLQVKEKHEQGLSHFWKYTNIANMHINYTLGSEGFSEKKKIHQTFPQM